jgi:hypothetical protein
MKEQLPLDDLAKIGWKTFEEKESIVLYSDRTTRAGNYHYDRRGSIESSLYGYVKIGKNEENSEVEAILFGMKDGESEIEKAWKFPLDFFKLDELLFGKFPAYLFGATNIKEIRNISKKYS